jgi:hypothetical protein
MESMGLRGLAGEMARNTSGVWRGVADALDPDGRRSSGGAPIDLTEPDPEAESSGTSTDVPVAGPITGAGDSFQEQGGRMIVPLDTWTRILEQVGHVHEAGQQMADAKERAARAETENRFLHEQIKELKSQRRPTRRTTPKPATPRPTTRTAAPPPATEPPAAETLTTRARRRASNWLHP